MKEYQFTILGRPASKKNNRRNFGRISLPSKAFMRFQSEAIPQLLEQYKGPAINQPITVIYHFYLKGKYKQDGDNAEASINDVLQEAGIVSNDFLINEVHRYRTLEAAEWKTAIFITDKSFQELDKYIKV